MKAAVISRALRRTRACGTRNLCLSPRPPRIDPRKLGSRRAPLQGVSPSISYFLPAERFRHVFLRVVTKAPLRAPAFPARLEHRNR
jgi:hypothetical protein